MSPSIPPKRCTKCGEEKPLDAFSKARWTRDGRYPSCKACKNAQAAEHRATHLEKHRARSRDYHRTHTEQRQAASHAYYESNRDRILTRTTRYQQEHPEQVKTYKRTYRDKHREEHLPAVRQRSAEWRAANRDKDRAASKHWRNRNRSAYRAIQHRHRARMKGNGGSYTAGQWEALKAHYGYRCLCCGRIEPEIMLTVDHVVPIALGGSNDITNIQPLCLSCNCSKQDRTIDYR